MAVFLENRRAIYDRNVRSGSGVEVAGVVIIQSATKRTGWFSGRIAIPHRGLLAHVDCRRRKRTHPTDAAHEFHFLEFAAIAQVDHVTHVSGVGSRPCDRTERTRYSDTRGRSVTKCYCERRGFPIRQLMLEAGAHYAGGLAIAIAYLSV